MSGTSVRQSFVRSSLLPSLDKGTQVKKEITGGAAAGIELNLACAARLSIFLQLLELLESIMKIIEVLLSDHPLLEAVFCQLLAEESKS